jgi:carbonic anhydrase
VVFVSRKEIQKLASGFRKFRDEYFANEHPLYPLLTTGVGQTPKSLLIGCSDSRVDPAIITSAEPGELFIVRNVANLVPPYEVGGGVHGVSAAIEFAVENLKVENIIILGHRQCGGIRALMLNQSASPDGFLDRWVKIAEDAKLRVLKNYPGEDEESLCKNGELESIKTSLRNLRTFPFVEKAVKDRGLSLIGIYFDLELGILMELDQELGQFRNLEI